MCLSAVAALAGCHGPPVQEALPDGGGGASGTTGTAGSSAGASGGAGQGGTTGTGGSGGGTGGIGGGGTGGTGGGGIGGSGGGISGSGGACAAQLQPVLFYEGMSSPVSSDGTSTRYYWVEYDPPNFTVRYLLGSPPANEYKHPFQVDASVAGVFSVAVNDTRVAAAWNAVGQVAVYGPDYNSLQIGSTLTLDKPSAVALSGTLVFYSHNPTSGNPTPGIYQWQSPAAATLFESFIQLGTDTAFGQLLRTTPSKLLLSDLTNVRMVGLAATGVTQTLFANPTGQTVRDVRPARPHDRDGGVLVQLQDDMFFGRDYYVDITMPGNLPTDLATATTALADESACGTAAHYGGPGVLYMQRYIYQGQSGLFAVNVSPTGGVSNLVRLSDLPLFRPEVTGAGDLFACARTASSSLYYYYRVGKL